MKPAEILERMAAAIRIVEALPEDANILTVQIDGLDVLGTQRVDYIQLATPFERLAEANMIKDGSWTVRDEPGKDCVEQNILIRGFQLLCLKDRERAAPGVASTEDDLA